MPDRKDPYRNFAFVVEINSQQVAGFSEVTGFDTTVDPIDYREGWELPHVRKLSGLTKYGNVTLKRGVTDDLYFTDWLYPLTQGACPERRVVTISLRDCGGVTANPDLKAQWEVTDAWPTKYTPMSLNAKGNEVSIETLELVNEGVKRLK